VHASRDLISETTGSCPDRGFTLVELLIALSLIGLITLLLFSGLRLGTRAWEGVETTADRTAELRVARNFLERALVQALMNSMANKLVMEIKMVCCKRKLVSSFES